jgi:hypothetical protein
MENLYVDTPKGKRFHGTISDNHFRRQVSEQKDLMRIFDAWAIHPKALEKLNELNVKDLVYTTSKGETYTISLEDANLHGFEKEFKGGKTVYIQRKYWQLS